MTWDLFSAAAADRADEARNADLARAVAARQADGALPAPRARSDEMTVAELARAARELVEGYFPPLWVRGEVASFTRARSGHCYFTLRDDAAQLRCVMWREEARRLPTTPAEGMEVRALARVTLYEPRGDFQLVVHELEAKGEGLWKLAFDRLKARLEAEGLTSPARRRPLPRHPAVVGVVTSGTGAALHDVVSVIRRRAPWTRVVLSDCRVQGEGAAEDVACALRRMYRWGGADVIIVGRGGGSTEDLWAFNEEAVARAISESPVPIVSAVGHEVDHTIADLVADLRAPTPSAAAEAVVPDGDALRRSLAECGTRLVSGARRRVEDAAAERAAGETALRRAMDASLRRRGEALAAAAGRLHALSPLAALGRGFAVATGADGRVLRSAGDFAEGMPFTLRVTDGTVPARVDGPVQPLEER